MVRRAGGAASNSFVMNAHRRNVDAVVARPFQVHPTKIVVPYAADNAAWMARVALARRLAIIMHAMLRDGTEFASA